MDEVYLVDGLRSPIGRFGGALSALRTPAPGELYHHHLERLAWMDELGGS